MAYEMVMPYHLHMPSYFLETFTEYPYEVGFSYPRYFSTSFKQMKGVTPSQFKEKNKNSGHI